jgi:hypothetical protein
MQVFRQLAGGGVDQRILRALSERTAADDTQVLGAATLVDKPSLTPLDRYHAVCVSNALAWQ